MLATDGYLYIGLRCLHLKFCQEKWSCLSPFDPAIDDFHPWKCWMKETYWKSSFFTTAYSFKVRHVPHCILKSVFYTIMHLEFSVAIAHETRLLCKPASMDSSVRACALFLSYRINHLKKELVFIESSGCDCRLRSAWIFLLFVANCELWLCSF